MVAFYLSSKLFLMLLALAATPVFGCLSLFFGDAADAKHQDNADGKLIQESYHCFNESAYFNCSCSRPCSLYDTCCTSRFQNASTLAISKLFSWPIESVKMALKNSPIQCIDPKRDRYLRELMATNRFRFADDVPAFLKSPRCQRQADEAPTPVATPILAKWPVFETRTGLIFLNMDEAKCTGRKIRKHSNSSFAKTSELEYWPSFRIVCHGNETLEQTFDDFDPFSQKDSDRFEKNNNSCVVELYQPENASFASAIAFCRLRSDVKEKCTESEEEEAKTTKWPRSKANGRYLMSFRLLMDFSMEENESMFVYGDDETPFQQHFYRYAALACMALSIISLGVMLAIYSLFRQLRNLPGKVTMCLSSALFVALLGYAIGVLAIPKIWYPVCFSIAVLIHFCFLVSFFFGSCLAFDIWRTFFKEQSDTNSPFASTTSDKLFLRYNIFSWGFPAVVVLVAIGVEFAPSSSVWPRPRYSSPIAVSTNSNSNNSPSHSTTWVCWMMNRTAVMAYFNVPIGVCLFVSIVFFIMTIVLIARASTHSSKLINSKNKTAGHAVNLRRRLVIYLKLSTIMGLTWLFGLVAALAQVEILWLPYALANALQGFYICLSFVCNRRVIRLLRLWLSVGSRDDQDFRRRSSVYSTSGVYNQRTLMTQRRSISGGTNHNAAAASSSSKRSSLHELTVNNNFNNNNNSFSKNSINNNSRLSFSVAIDEEDAEDVSAPLKPADSPVSNS